MTVYSWIIETSNWRTKPLAKLEP